MFYKWDTVKDEESHKWGYVISSSHYQNFDKPKIEKKVLNQFKTEDEAKTELDKEMSKYLDNVIYNKS